MVATRYLDGDVYVLIDSSLHVVREGAKDPLENVLLHHPRQVRAQSRNDYQLGAGKRRWLVRALLVGFDEFCDLGFDGYTLLDFGGSGGIDLIPFNGRDGCCAVDVCHIC